MRSKILNSKNIVIKFGSKILLSHFLENKLTDQMINFSQALAKFQEKNYSFTIVSSGAVALGMNYLKLDKRPTNIKRIQALASIGQNILMQQWSDLLSKVGLKTSQILFTMDVFENRKRFLHAQDCLSSLRDYGVIPVINENDSVAIDELKFGDNDTLSALTSHLVDADLLILFTDTNGLYDENPHKNPKAKRISFLQSVEEENFDLIDDRNNSLSLGGMTSKLNAAKLSSEGGVDIVIADGHELRLNEILSGQDIGTFIASNPVQKKEKKRWIFFNQRIKGKIYIDSGAEQALLYKQKSLLPGGIINIDSEFSEDCLVGILNSNGKMIAKGITYYSSQDIIKIKGKQTSEIFNILQRDYFEEVIDRNNMIIL